MLVAERCVKPHFMGKRLLGLDTEIFDDWMPLLKSKGVEIAELSSIEDTIPLNLQLKTPTLFRAICFHHPAPRFLLAICVSPGLALNTQPR